MYNLQKKRERENVTTVSTDASSACGKDAKSNLAVKVHHSFLRGNLSIDSSVCEMYRTH